MGFEPTPVEVRHKIPEIHYCFAPNWVLKTRIFFSMSPWHEHIKEQAWFIHIPDRSNLLSLQKKISLCGFAGFLRKFHFSIILVSKIAKLRLEVPKLGILKSFFHMILSSNLNFNKRILFRMSQFLIGNWKT